MWGAPRGEFVSTRPRKLGESQIDWLTTKDSAGLELNIYTVYDTGYIVPARQAIS